MVKGSKMAFRTTCHYCGTPIVRGWTCTSKSCRAAYARDYRAERSRERERRIRRDSEAEKQQVAECREANHLPPIHPGRRPCQMCGKEFESWDIAHNVLCGACKYGGRDEVRLAYYTPPDVSVLEEFEVLQ